MRSAGDIGIEYVNDAFKWLDPDDRTVHTDAGARLEYDALLLAPRGGPAAAGSGTP